MLTQINKGSDSSGMEEYPVSDHLGRGVGNRQDILGPVITPKRVVGESFRWPEEVQKRRDRRYYPSYCDSVHLRSREAFHHFMASYAQHVCDIMFFNKQV